MDLEELAAIVQDLAGRVALLESADDPGRRQAIGLGDLAVVESIITQLSVGGDESASGGAVLYAGAGPGPDGLTAWQVVRPWSDLTGADPATLAGPLAGLASPHRIQILQLLLHGPVTTAELTEQLAGPSSGQLFHHLKELLAAGLVYQPSRGSYAVRHQHVVPLLGLLSCAIDLHGIPAVPNPGEP
jgi:DNA-binding transcriptional ArsR family regulator